MDQDTLNYDTLPERPLPKWLTDQRDGLNTIKPVIKEIRDDRSLEISFIITGFIILLTLFVMTIIVVRKNRKNNL